MTQIFDRRWILDINALSYIAGRDREALKESGLIGGEDDLLFCPWPQILNPSPHEAALILQRLIVDQKVGVRPIDGDEDWSFFRFAIPDPNGGAFNVKHRKRLERFEVDSRELLAAIPPASTKQTSEKHPGGRPPKYNWNLAEQRIEKECRLLDGVPHPGHPDPEWRQNSDVYPIVRELFDGKPSESALKRIVPPMLKRIKAKLANGQN
jgi:hypothetical protein